MLCIKAWGCVRIAEERRRLERFSAFPAIHTGWKYKKRPGPMDTANHAKRPEKKGNTESSIMRGSRPRGYAHIVAGIRPRRERLPASGARPRGANTPKSRHGEKSRGRAENDTDAD